MSEHPWEGTQHCLRFTAIIGENPNCKIEAHCCNDHTGCCWNDGHNECLFKTPPVMGYDSPLAKKSS